ncbi:MAG: polysaccharide pyruvyl transferase family protein [Candidatus Marinimicrobia bacterium]|nr:polysaccharide pyruvyl transferase family protein [Candidatus Neomarinimicrobiota bacterium]
MSEQKIILYGAFDRYNYGDILIPIILSKYLQDNGFVNIEYCSIKNADLSTFGGFKCTAINPQKIPENSSIIVAGGEVLNVDWTSITSYFMGWLGNRCIRVARLIFPRTWVNTLCIKIMNGRFKYPFLVEKETLKKSIKTIYNGVGGVSIKESDNTIKSIMENADFVSVRDKNANETLNTNWGMNNKLTPDIANAVSKFYPIDRLLTSISHDTKSFIEDNQNGYFCIQIAQQYTRGKTSTIVESLSKILSMGVPIVLLPLGTVSGHEDDNALKKIHDMLASKNVFLLRNIHLEDSICLIANATVFAGTSLHGNITAMSYAVPHFPLNQHVEKLTHYVKTWDISDIKPCPDYSQIHEFYEQSTKIDENLLIENRDRLISHIDENMDEIYKTISSANE